MTGVGGSSSSVPFDPTTIDVCRLRGSVSRPVLPVSDLDPLVSFSAVDWTNSLTRGLGRRKPEPVKT